MKRILVLTLMCFSFFACEKEEINIDDENKAPTGTLSVSFTNDPYDKDIPTSEGSFILFKSKADFNANQPEGEYEVYSGAQRTISGLTEGTYWLKGFTPGYSGVQNERVEISRNTISYVYFRSSD